MMIFHESLTSRQRNSDKKKIFEYNNILIKNVDINNDVNTAKIKQNENILSNCKYVKNKKKKKNIRKLIVSINERAR